MTKMNIGQYYIDDDDQTIGAFSNYLEDSADGDYLVGAYDERLQEFQDRPAGVTQRGT
jgi:hypothetical protein